MNWLTQLFQRPPQAPQAPQAGNMLAQAAQPQQQPQGPGFMQRFQNFAGSDRGQYLGDMFSGWAMGSTPGESLGYGTLLARQGMTDRRTKQQEEQQQNQTLEWLRAQGLDEGSAAAIASNPQVLQQYMSETMIPEKPQTTDDIREYNFAVQQGFGGSFNDYMTQQRRAGATTVNNNIPGAPTIGTIPQGWAAQQDQATGEWSMQPIAGGPAAAEAVDAARRQELASGNALNSSDIVTTAASRARKAASQQNFGSAGTTVVGRLPWTDSAEVVRQVGALKSQATLGNLQAMRDASPTGGALGNVSEGELKILEDKSGSLDPNSPNFLRDLDDYERTLLRTIHGREAGDRIFAETRQEEDAPDFSTMSTEELEAYINGR